MMAWLLAVLVAVSPDLDGYAWPHRSAAAPIRAITGNGQLTAGIDGAGHLAQLRWPGLGHGDHLHYRAEDERTAGAGWVFTDGGGAFAFGHGQWAIRHEMEPGGTLVTHYAELAGPRRATQRLHVAKDADLAAVELVLEGFSPELRCYWYQQLAPSTATAGGLPDGYARLSHLRSFATYADADIGMIVQFRPEKITRSDVARARRLAASGAADAAGRDFGDGVYWGTFSPTGASGVHCAPPGTPLEALLAEDPGPRWVAGEARAALRLDPEYLAEERQRFVLCLAVADSDAALRAHAAVVAKGGLPEAATFPPHIPLDDARREALAALLACVDENTGAAVRAPVSLPPLAHAAIFDSAWAAAALDDAGYHGVAAGILRFHLATVRETFGPAGAPGSLPAYVHTTGQPARFLDSANPAATAWLLAAIWRHVAVAPAEETGPLLMARENTLVDCGDFLARAPVVGGVLAGTLAPQAAPLATLQTHYLGLISARSILAHLGQEEPGHWRSRREEAYARIRFRQLDESRSGDGESPWLARWVAALPASAISDDGAWEVLRPAGALDAGDVLLPDGGSQGLSPDVPVALHAALASLGLE